MVRKLNWLLPLLGLLITVNTAQALGLGDINLKSSLNQPLLAEIELLEEESMSPGEIIPTLASNDDFVRAGIQREFFLSNLLFRLESRGNRQFVLVVYTEEPVLEPFLNFLVEISWPSGRLLKEFTLLLDPPLYDQITPGSTPVISMDDRPATVTETETEQTETRVQTPVPVRGPESLPPGQYRVQRNDTMWEIAVRTRPARSLTPQQVMLAIQDKNPSAFIGGNINRVKEGSLLNIPSEAEIRRWGQAEAIAEIARQNQLLSGGGATATAAPVTARSDTSSALPDGNVQDPEGYLELVGDSDAAGSATGTTVSQLEEELTRALELNDQFERENAELESRLSDLQEQLEILQSLVNLQSDTATALAAGDEIASEGEATEAESATAVQAPETETETETEASDTEEAADTTASQTGSAASRANSNLENMLAAGSAAASSQAGAASQQPAQTTEPAPAPMQSMDPNDPAMQDMDPNDPAMLALHGGMPMEDQGFIQYMINDLSAMVFGNPLYGAAAGLLVLLLILLLVNSMMKRRKAAAGDQDDESMLDLDEASEGDSFDDFDDEDDALTADEMADIDQKPSEEGGSDVITEADIYIAYSRYEQAEEILQTALNENPDREDIKIKLAEVYAESGNAKGFSKMEAALVAGSATALAALEEWRQRLAETEGGHEESLTGFSGNLENSYSTDTPPVLGSGSNQSDDLDIAIDDELSLDDMPADFDLGEDLVLENDSGYQGLSGSTGTLSDEAPLLSDEDDGGLDFDSDSFGTVASEKLEESDDRDSGLSFSMDDDKDELASADDLDLSADFGGLDDDAAPAVDKSNDSDAGSEDDGGLEFSLDDLDLNMDDSDQKSETEESADASESDGTLTLSEEDDDLPLDFEAEFDALTASEDTDDDDDKLDPLSSLEKQIAALDDTGRKSVDADKEDEAFSATEFSEQELADFGFESDEDKPAEADAEDDTSGDLDADLGDLDLNFDDSEFENLADDAEDNDESEVLDLSDEELDLSSLEGLSEDDSDDESDATESTLTEPEIAPEEPSFTATDDEADLSDEDDFELLAGADEASTKLDLARAYIDMDEQDAAREILEEVVQEGNEEQIGKAQDMLKKLAG